MGFPPQNKSGQLYDSVIYQTQSSSGGSYTKAAVYNLAQIYPEYAVQYTKGPENSGANANGGNSHQVPPANQSPNNDYQPPQPQQTNGRFSQPQQMNNQFAQSYQMNGQYVQQPLNNTNQLFQPAQFNAQYPQPQQTNNRFAQQPQVNGQFFQQAQPINQSVNQLPNGNNYAYYN